MSFHCHWKLGNHRFTNPSISQKQNCFISLCYLFPLTVFFFSVLSDGCPTKLMVLRFRLLFWFLLNTRNWNTVQSIINSTIAGQRHVQNGKSKIGKFFWILLPSHKLPNKMLNCTWTSLCPYLSLSHRIYRRSKQAAVLSQCDLGMVATYIICGIWWSITQCTYSHG